jgi:RimJ/RimL family protein N-acetyltransferase
MAGNVDLSAVAFTSDRLSLRAFVASDIAEAFAGATPTVARFMSWDPFPSVAAFADAWREWLPRMQAGTDLPLTLRLRSGGEFLGVAGVHAIGGAEVTTGLWLKEAVHGRGYGREAIAAIVTWASAKLGAKTFIYPVVEQNLPSRRLAESLGGIIAGRRVLKKASGAVFDQVVYRISAPAK